MFSVQCYIILLSSFFKVVFAQLTSFEKYLNLAFCCRWVFSKTDRSISKPIINFFAVLPKLDRSSHKAFAKGRLGLSSSRLQTCAQFCNRDPHAERFSLMFLVFNGFNTNQWNCSCSCVRSWWKQNDCSKAVTQHLSLYNLCSEGCSPTVVICSWAWNGWCVVGCV